MLPEFEQFAVMFGAFPPHRMIVALEELPHHAGQKNAGPIGPLLPFVKPLSIAGVDWKVLWVIGDQLSELNFGKIECLMISFESSCMVHRTCILEQIVDFCDRRVVFVIFCGGFVQSRGCERSSGYGVWNGVLLTPLALKSAAGRVHRPLFVDHRDLFRRPLEAAELDRFEAVVLDPPRAGAKEQAAALAGSTVPLIAYVSCNPSTFARDSALLVAGGYRLEWIQPVGQFRWSTHVELAGAFSRGGCTPS